MGISESYGEPDDLSNLDLRGDVHFLKEHEGHRVVHHVDVKDSHRWHSTRCDDCRSYVDLGYIVSGYEHRCSLDKMRAAVAVWQESGGYDKWLAKMKQDKESGVYDKWLEDSQAELDRMRESTK